MVDDRGKLVGILSNRDVLRALGQADIESVRIGDVMSKRLITCTEDTTAAEAAELMLEHKIGALPVLGDDGHLVGLVTESDFVRIAHDLLSDEPA
ncbi:MAG: CBS domain-containing protein [Deltaproteobacteria bacterium]|nr:MAG: CBS domain-containing protein [Deltaproteobacteria bacterium]